MLLKIVSPRYDPFWDGNSEGIDETELFQITIFDSLRLDGVTYTEQEARQITVSDVSINSPVLASYGVTSPTPLNSKLSKYLFIRVLIYDDNDQIYIDGAINRNSFKYFPATDTYTFTITDMLGVLIDWLGEREIEVDDVGAISIFSTLDNLPVPIIVQPDLPDQRHSFQHLIETVADQSGMCELFRMNQIPEAGYPLTRASFTFNSSISSTIEVGNLVLNDSFLSFNLKPITEYPTMVTHYSIKEVSPNVVYIYIINEIRTTLDESGFPAPLEQATYRLVMWKYAYGVLSEVPFISPLGWIDALYNETSGSIVYIDIDTNNPTYRSETIWTERFGGGEDYGVEPIKVQMAMLTLGNDPAFLEWSIYDTSSSSSYSITSGGVEIVLSFADSVFGQNMPPMAVYLRRDAYISVTGTANFTSTTLKEGKSTLKTLLKDITVSTDNYIVYSGANTFTTINRSLIPNVGTPIDVSDSAYSVRGLDLAVNSSLSIVVPNLENVDFELILTDFYQTQVADLYNIMIELNIGTIAPFQLNQVVSLNGINYRIFGIDYYNGLYKLTLYGNGYTNG